ncbi:hypothetical protein LCGC14_0478870 [marine sediment metagenome]|uniref:Uncharacterized protein n=1 Tax=marine sediment metagenome TaxID=412755 RepID=A0A0F9VIT4_9ZZZZ
MKEYWVILRQMGGCDYTIGCGVCVDKIKAKTIEDAVEYILEEYVGGYQNGEGCPDDIELLEVTRHIDMHMPLIRAQDLLQRKLEEKRKCKAEEAERAEYKRLKEKFDK